MPTAVANSHTWTIADQWVGASVSWRDVAPQTGNECYINSSAAKHIDTIIFKCTTNAGTETRICCIELYYLTDFYVFLHRLSCPGVLYLAVAADQFQQHIFRHFALIFNSFFFFVVVVGCRISHSRRAIRHHHAALSSEWAVSDSVLMCFAAAHTLDVLVSKWISPKNNDLGRCRVCRVHSLHSRPLAVYFNLLLSVRKWNNWFRSGETVEEKWNEKCSRNEKWPMNWCSNIFYPIWWCGCPQPVCPWQSAQPTSVTVI